MVASAGGDGLVLQSRHSDIDVRCSILMGACFVSSSRCGRFGQCGCRPITPLRGAFSARNAHVVPGKDDLHARMPKLTILLKITAAAYWRTGFGLRPTVEVCEFDPAIDAGEVAFKFGQCFGEYLIFSCLQKPAAGRAA